MNLSEGFQTALNEIRETLIEDNKLYQTQIPVVDYTTSSQVYGHSLLSLPADLRNKFINALVDRIAYTSFNIRYYKNPFENLKGNETPLGAIGQNVYVNPAKGRVYNIDDFAGLLAKYESDVKAEYNEINADFQYPATIVRQELQKAFVSWRSFEDLIMGISASLYNGSYIDQYKLTKLLISNAYRTNSVEMKIVSFAGATPTKDELENLTALLRELYLDFQEPSDEYNAWKKVGGYGRAIETWTPPEDIIVFVNNKMASWLDVKVLANAFNIDKAELKGRVYTTKNFDVYDEDGTKIFDGSNIIAQICDKRWFKIRDIDMFMDEFYNANNRSWQKFLNYRGSYNYSFFANAVQLVTALPSINATAIQFAKSSETLTMGTPKVLEIVTTPVSATETINFTSSDAGGDYVTIEKIDNRHVKVTPVSATGSAVTITATGGTSGVSGTCEVNVNDIQVNNMNFKYSTRSITGTGKVTNELIVNPENFSEPINFTSSDVGETYVTIEKKSNTKVEVTGVSNTSDPVIITATGSVSGKTATFNVSVSGN